MITPLRKRTLDGALYTRDPRIESLLEELSSLSRDELLERVEVSERSDSAYVPSECLLYFVRASRMDNNDAWFERLYKKLDERVLRGLPAGDDWDGQTESYSRLEIRDRAHDRFGELLALDRTSPQERLDYFEVRFDGALASLRRDAQAQVWREESRSVSLDSDDDAGQVLAQVERAAAEHVDPFDPFGVEEEEFRFRLDAAIEKLPDEQRSVLEMLRQGFQIDSKEAGVMTISSVLGKSDKTIRNYRDRAYATLRAALTEGDVP